jgi:hypothetical protein
MDKNVWYRIWTENWFIELEKELEEPPSLD